MTEQEAKRQGEILQGFDRRIEACVDACKGIPTGDLEDGIIEKAMRAMVDLEALQAWADSEQTSDEGEAQ